MLQISFIILFRISLKISSFMLNFILFMLLLLSLFPICNLNYQAIELYIHMQLCTNNTIIRGLRLPHCWYSLSVCNQEYSRECSCDSHSFGCTNSEQARIVSSYSYSVYLCYLFCIVYVIL